MKMTFRELKRLCAKVMRKIVSVCDKKRRWKG